MRPYCYAALLVAALVLTACDAGDEGQPATATPSPGAPPSPTVDPARRELSDDVSVPRLVAAVVSGDVDGVVANIDWRPTPCSPSDGDGHNGVDACPQGVAASTELPMIDGGGEGPQFWVLEATLRPLLDAILKPDSLALRYAGRSKADPSKLYLGFDGPPKGPGFAPFADPDTTLVGLFLILDADAEALIQNIDELGEPSSGGSAAISAGERWRRIDDQDVIIGE